MIVCAESPMPSPSPHPDAREQRILDAMQRGIFKCREIARDTGDSHMKVYRAQLEMAKRGLLVHRAGEHPAFALPEPVRDRDAA